MFWLGCSRWVLRSGFGFGWSARGKTVPAMKELIRKIIVFGKWDWTRELHVLLFGHQLMWEKIARGYQCKLWLCNMQKELRPRSPEKLSCTWHKHSNAVPVNYTCPQLASLHFGAPLQVGDESQSRVTSCERDSTQTFHLFQEFSSCSSRRLRSSSHFFALLRTSPRWSYSAHE